jgi:hypothetical protein
MPGEVRRRMVKPDVARPLLWRWIATVQRQLDGASNPEYF